MRYPKFPAVVLLFFSFTLSVSDVIMTCARDVIGGRRIDCWTLITADRQGLQQQPSTVNIRTIILINARTAASYVTVQLLPVCWVTCLARPRRYICIAWRLSHSKQNELATVAVKSCRFSLFIRGVLGMKWYDMITSTEINERIKSADLTLSQIGVI